MSNDPYAQLVRYKQWADDGLLAVVADHFDRLEQPDATILLRILDHFHVVDRVFQHHLQGVPHAFHAPRSDDLPDLDTLASSTRAIDAWYVAYVDGLRADAFAEPIDFVFTNGTPARMTRGEMLLHVSLHGTYHRGNAGLLLQKNGIMPNDDRMTDFLASAA